MGNSITGLSSRSASTVLDRAAATGQQGGARRDVDDSQAAGREERLHGEEAVQEDPEWIGRTRRTTSPGSMSLTSAILITAVPTSIGKSAPLSGR